MESAVELFRNRYILEFARPSNGTSGLHEMVVSTPDPSAIVRLSGIAFPVQDKDLLSRPDTLPSNPSRAPLIGDRRILTQPH